LCGLLAPLLAGSSVVIPPKFSAHTFWRDFTTEKCNWYTAVPTIHSILLVTPHSNPLPHIRFIRSCSSSLSPTVFHNLEKTFNAPVLEAYAMSEAAHAMCGSPLPKNGPRYPGSVGKPQGVELTIRSAEDGKELAQGQRGEVCIRGKNVMLGYVNNEKANKEGFWDGGARGRWFRTGDEGYLTEEGYLVLTGRLKEVSPLER
jgi:acyl-CoA synthetase (AMP-forming)/AMP-acid ligase II